MRALTPAQARTLLDAARGDRLEALSVLAVATGMRRGELLALTWADIDLNEATLRVTATLQRTAAGFMRAEPKTARSRRLVLLTPAAVTSLRERRRHCIAERLRAGGAWDDRWGLVFSTTTGRPIDGSNLISRSFGPLVARAGVPRVRFHDLRHTCATLLLSKGVHAKVVSDLLGHSTIAITLDTYSHVLPPMQRQAAEAMAGILDGTALGG
jgi:integrase